MIAPGPTFDRVASLELRATAVVCFAAWCTAILVAATGTATHPAAMALVAAALVGVPCLGGLASLRVGEDPRFARLLVAGGLTLALVTLSTSAASLPYSLGRTAEWLVEPGIVALVLAFPAGRLSGRTDRAIVAGLALLVATLYLPTLPFTV